MSTLIPPSGSIELPRLYSKPLNAKAMQSFSFIEITFFRNANEERGHRKQKNKTKGNVSTGKTHPPPNRRVASLVADSQVSSARAEYTLSKLDTTY